MAVRRSDLERRAEARGYRHRTYHGTNRDPVLRGDETVPEFREVKGRRPFWSSFGVERAEIYAGRSPYVNDYSDDRARILPLRVHDRALRAAYKADANAVTTPAREILEVYTQAKELPGFDFGRWMKSMETFRQAVLSYLGSTSVSVMRFRFWNSSTDVTDAYLDLLKASGFRAIRADENGDDTIGVLYPEDVRSAFAKFEDDTVNDLAALTRDRMPRRGLAGANRRLLSAIMKRARGLGSSRPSPIGNARISASLR